MTTSSFETVFTNHPSLKGLRVDAKKIAAHCCICKWLAEHLYVVVTIEVCKIIEQHLLQANCSMTSIFVDVAWNMIFEAIKEVV